MATTKPPESPSPERNTPAISANGYYDLATPLAATKTKYTFARMGLDLEVRKNVSMDFFPAGHMMYIDRTSHAKLKKDVMEFVKAVQQ